MHKTVTKSKFLAFLAVIALFSAVIFAGGCGGSSSSNDKLTLSYDQDKDGIPDIFDDYPGSVSKQRYQEAKEFETLAGVEGEKFAVSLPCRGSGKFEAAKDVSGETNRYFLFKAEKGKRVCILFSSPEHNLTRAFPFIPDVTIYPYEPVPAPVEEPQDEQEEEQELPENEPETETGNSPNAEISDFIDNSIKYEVEEYGSGAFSALSFTPEKDGIYVMKVRKANAGWEKEDGAEAVDCGFAFSIFEDKDGNGLDDVWKSDYTRDDFVDVLTCLQPFISGVGKDGTPEMREKIVIWTRDDGTEEMQTPEEAVTDYINALNEKAETAEGNGSATMTRELYGLPFIDGFGMSNLGKGLNAVFGPRSTTGEKIVASMTAPDKSKYTDGFKASTTLEFINTDTQLEKEVSNTASVGVDTMVGKTPLKISDKHSWANSTKFSETTTTLRIKYTRLSNEYLDGTNVKLTADAEKALNKDTSAGKAAFRREYGDYYLAGCQIGAQCVATLSITASSKQDITTIQNVLNGTIGSVKLDNDFKSKLTQALGKTRIKYSCSLVGGDDIPLPKAKTGEGGAAEMVSNIVENVNAYMKGVKASNMAVINCHFKHISTLTDKFPAAMPVSKDYFAKEGRLYNLLWSMQARANVIDSLDSNIFADSEKQKFAGKYAAFQRKIDNITDESEMISNIDSNVMEAQNVLGEMQAVIDRYYFWYKLIEQRKNWWYKNGWGTYGFKNYPDSKVLNDELQDKANIKKFGIEKHVGGAPWSDRANTPKEALTYDSKEKTYVLPAKTYVLPENYRVVYVSLNTNRLTHDTVWDEAWETTNTLSFGGRELWHELKGGWGRGVDWSTEHIAYYMPPNKYPFRADSLDNARPTAKREERVKKDF